MKQSTENKCIHSCFPCFSSGACKLKPAELNLASQDWEKELKTAIKIFKVEGLTEHQLFLYVKDLLSLARTEGYNEGINWNRPEIFKARIQQAVAEYQAELKKLIAEKEYDCECDDCNYASVNTGNITKIITVNDLLSLISPNKE